VCLFSPAKIQKKIEFQFSIFNFQFFLCIFASSITRTLWRVSGWATGHNKKTLKRRFICGVRISQIQIQPHDKTKSAPIGVIYTFLVYCHSVGSALFILGWKACESLVRGINDEFRYPRFFFICPLINKLFLVQVSASNKNSNKTMKENLNRKREYDTPMVELIEARVEKGFQPSGTSPIIGEGTGEAVTETGSADNALFT
jgi:hypothetical protein